MGNSLNIHIFSDQEEKIDAYRGPSELELIAPLFKQTTCSYRVISNYFI